MASPVVYADSDSVAPHGEDENAQDNLSPEEKARMRKEEKIRKKQEMEARRLAQLEARRRKQVDALKRSEVTNVCSRIIDSRHFPEPEQRRKKTTKAFRALRRRINEDREEENMDTVLHVGELRFLENTLLPLALDCKDDPDTLFELAKLVVQLTMPLSLEGRPEEEAHDLGTQQQNKQRLLYLRRYKAAFLHKGVLQTFTVLLDKPLLADSSSRTVSGRM